ncbi:MAG: hypothetical protein AAB152_01610 [Candidatus Coatesbacteria bacterium]
MSTPLPARPNLEHLRNEAHAMLKAHTSGDRSVCAVLKGLRRFSGETDDAIMRAEVGLQEVQLALAIKYGFKDWAELKARVEGTVPPSGIPPRFGDVEELAGLGNSPLQRLFMDLDDLDQALVASTGSSHLRQRLFDNMTVRHRERLERLPEVRTAGAARIAEARSRALWVANKLSELGLVPLEPPAAGDAAVSARTSDALRKLEECLRSGPSSRWSAAQLAGFFGAAAGAWMEPMTLAPLVPRLDDPFLRDGIELFVDGWAPDYVRSVMTERKRTLLAEHERRCDIGTTALVSIGWAEHPKVLEERCRALLGPDAAPGHPVAGEGKSRIEELEVLLAAKPASAWTPLELIEVMKTALGVARAGGLLALDGIPDRLDDPFLKAPMQLLVDGCDVELVRSILLDRKRTLLGDQERRLDMVVTALCGMAAGDSPRVIEAKCRAFLPAESGPGSV